jgi:hypothetical protein
MDLTHLTGSILVWMMSHGRRANDSSSITMTMTHD